MRRRQRGQALVYVALVMVVLITVVYATFDLGRLVSAKIQAQNAADAAALAAVSLKVSVHNTRSFAYLAMTEQAIQAKIHMIQAIGALSGKGLPTPGSPPSAAELKEFEDHLKQARRHMEKVRLLKEGLKAYNAWIETEGPAMVAEAARVAYVANLDGMNSHLVTGRAVDQNNLRLLDVPGALRENGTGEAARMLGGVNYVNEGTSKNHGSGKSFVEVSPRFVPFAVSLFGAPGAPVGGVNIPAWAAAGPVSSSAVEKAGTGHQDLKVGQLGINWYTPRLMRTGQKEGGRFGSAKEGGIVSEH